jgi:cytochrome b involved in lipid metabolism
MALFTFGEGYHNYHHEFQYDYRNGVKPWQWDPTKWLIWILSKLGFDERSAPSATGGNLLLASATLEFTKGQKPLTRATEIGRIQTFGISCASNMQ